MNKTKTIQKNAKKKEAGKKVENASSNSELRQLLTLIVVIVVILLLVYVVSSLLKGKDYSSIFDNSLDVSEIQYDEVLVGTMLKQKEEVYYVLVIDDEDPYQKNLNTYFDNYIGLEYDMRIYKVDLSNIFNRSSKSEEASYSDELKFNTSVLMKIENGSIEEVIDDSSEIANKMIEMIKATEES